MSKPRRQHFIPKSYLRNFSDVDGDKHFVEVMNVNTGEIKYPFSLSNVCVSKNLYTLPHVDENAKFSVEHFYAENVDAVYPEIYDLLTNPAVHTISDEQRQKILNTCLSLYFRNARFLEEKNDEVDYLINRIRENENASDNASFFIQYGGRKYNFERNDLEVVREQIVLNNRIDFILNHLEDWQKFVRFKTNSQIAVSRILGDVKLITSDNPVRISNHRRENFQLFDDDNSIQLPLDEEHLLWISPNDEEIEPNIICRGVRDKWFAITSNHTMHQDASEWIIGKKGEIYKYIEEDKRYNNFRPENLQALENIQVIATELSQFIEYAKVNGGVTSDKSIAKLRELKKIPAFAKDPQFQLICFQLAAKGYVV